MNILRIRYFVEVVRCGSFSLAAANLYTAQSNISKQIAQLEQELGFSLFTRSHRMIALTPAGSHLYDCWKDLPDRVDADIRQARKLAEQATVISIGVLEGQDLNDVLQQRLEAAGRQLPGYTFSLERNSYKNLRTGLRSGYYDLIVTLDFDLEDEPDLKLFTLYQKQPAVAMRRSNPLANRKDIALPDLKDQSFVVISPQESPGGYARLMDSCHHAGFTPNIVREPRSLESLLLCVEMGIGIALLDQNTRLELSPYIVTIPQDAAPMRVVLAISDGEQRSVIRGLVRCLAPGEQDESAKAPEQG